MGVGECQNPGFQKQIQAARIRCWRGGTYEGEKDTVGADAKGDEDEAPPRDEAVENEAPSTDAAAENEGPLTDGAAGRFSAGAAVVSPGRLAAGVLQTGR